jgi:hypothetical protein
MGSNRPTQIERKRHLGNDILMIVFKEGNGPPFSPNTITSEFNRTLTSFLYLFV